MSRGSPLVDSATSLRLAGAVGCSKAVEGRADKVREATRAIAFSSRVARAGTRVLASRCQGFMAALRYALRARGLHIPYTDARRRAAGSLKPRREGAEVTAKGLPRARAVTALRHAPRLPGLPQCVHRDGLTGADDAAVTQERRHRRAQIFDLPLDFERRCRLPEPAARAAVRDRAATSSGSPDVRRGVHR
jgi:hypothetical protein